MQSQPTSSVVCCVLWHDEMKGGQQTTRNTEWRPETLSYGHNLCIKGVQEWNTHTHPERKREWKKWQARELAWLNLAAVVVDVVVVHSGFFTMEGLEVGEQPGLCSQFLEHEMRKMGKNPGPCPRHVPIWAGTLPEFNVRMVLLVVFECGAVLKCQARKPQSTNWECFLFRLLRHNEHFMDVQRALCIKIYATTDSKPHEPLKQSFLEHLKSLMHKAK